MVLEFRRVTSLTPISRAVLPSSPVSVDCSTPVADGELVQKAPQQNEHWAWDAQLFISYPVQALGKSYHSPEPLIPFPWCPLPGAQGEFYQLV